MNNARRIWPVVGVVVLLTLVVAGWLGRPAYRRYKERRVFAQAVESFRKGDYRAAHIGLRQTLEINPGNLEAIRAMGDFATEAKSPGALDWRRRAVDLSPTLDHKLLLADTGLRVEKPPYPVASQVLAELRASGVETNPAYHFVASQRAIRLNLSGEAEQHLLALTRLDPTNRVHRLSLATVRLRSKDSAVADAARRELTALANEPALAVPALRSLVNDALADRRFADADRLCVQLVALPKVFFEDRLLRLNVLQQSQSAELPKWIDEVKAAAGTNTLRIAATTDWLNDHGFATNALTWLDSLPSTLQTTVPLPGVRADSYVAMRDWAALEKYLVDQRWDDQEFLRLALLSRALREQGRRELATAQWRRAVVTVGPRVEGLVALAQIARSWGWDGEAEETLWAAARRAPWLDWAWQGLCEYREAAGDTPGLLRVRSAQLESVPDSVPAKNDVAITSLLLKTDVERASRLASELYQAQPTNAVHVSTYAFALHLQGKTAEAAKLMQTLPEKVLLQPGIAAYQAILLAAAGKRDQAAPYFAAAEKARLLPEERRLIEEARALK